MAHDETPDQPQVMPRPPGSLWPPDGPRTASLPEAPTDTPRGVDDGPVAVLVQQYRDLGAQHRQFLAIQSRISELIATQSTTPTAEQTRLMPVQFVLDPKLQPWLRDHCPTWTVPVVPLTVMVDILAAASDRICGLENVEILRWLPIPGPTHVRVNHRPGADRSDVTLEVWQDASRPEMARWAPVATATVLHQQRPAPQRFPTLADTCPMELPYEGGDLFHGPSFQYLTRWSLGAHGASGTLCTERGSVPRGVLHPGLLDSALHVIPHHDLRRWSPTSPKSCLGFPHRLDWLTAHRALPNKGDVEVEARFVGVDPENPQLVHIDIQLCVDDDVLVAFRVVDILIPAGPLAQVPGTRRRGFLRDREYFPELLASRVDGTNTVLDRDAIDRADTVPGTVAAVYALPPGAHPRDWLAVIAAKEHLARHLKVHPARVEFDPTIHSARLAGATRSYPLEVVQHHRSSATVHDRPTPAGLS